MEDLVLLGIQDLVRSTFTRGSVRRRAPVSVRNTKTGTRSVGCDVSESRRMICQ
jgi:hypothetical protein